MNQNKVAVGEGRKLFKYYLEKHENHYNTRPQFIYRTHRFKFNTFLRRPLSFFSPWYSFNGWVFKGGLAYLAWYYLLQRKPHTPHWNRQGYHYETKHKTANTGF